MRVWLVLLFSFLAMPGFGQGPAMDMVRPIDAVDSVFIEELTWMEVRDAIHQGKSTALVATGGIEQNGPYLVTGKHNVVLRAVTEAIARELGDTLVAPIIKLVPEGDFDPPTGHMKYPGRAFAGDVQSSAPGCGQKLEGPWVREYPLHWG